PKVAYLVRRSVQDGCRQARPTSRPDRHGAKDRQPLVTSSRAPRPVLYRASPRSRGSDDEGAVCETAVTPIVLPSMKFVDVALRAAGGRKMRPTRAPSASTSRATY